MLKVGSTRGITSLRLRNFRSIRSATIRLADLTIFVGPNASGKSNLLDALRFLAECMNGPLASAVERRGGAESLRHRGSLGGSIEIGVSLKLPGSMSSPAGWDANYTFELDVTQGSEARVVREHIRLYSTTAGPGSVSIPLDRDEQGVRLRGQSMPEVGPDPHNLLLPLVGGAETFRMVFEALRTLRVYRIDPMAMRGIGDRDVAGVAPVLRPDAANAAEVLRRMKEAHRADYDRVNEYLRVAVPQLDAAYGKSYGSKLVLVGRQASRGRVRQRHDFEARDLSDGTLRLLGLLLALNQPSMPPTLAIEEPEASLHPAAAGVVWDALHEAGTRTQVLVTTHSPEVLDNKDIPAGVLRLVSWRNNATTVRPLGKHLSRALARHELTAGELLRANALTG